MTNSNIVSASFRDPSGFVFSVNKEIYRQVNTHYKENYDLLMTSGLYENLTKSGLMVSHQETSIKSVSPESAYKTIKPTASIIISYC